LQRLIARLDEPFQLGTAHSKVATGHLKVEMSRCKLCNEPFLSKPSPSTLARKLGHRILLEVKRGTAGLVTSIIADSGWADVAGTIASTVVLAGSR
jgi:hypothetical protein